MSVQSSPREQLIIVGNGMGCVRFLEHLCADDSHGYDITVLSEEPVPGYNRIMLSPLLAGDISVDGLSLQTADWYRERGIRLLCGTDYRVVNLDRDNQQLETMGGQSVRYDCLILATGSRPAMPNIPGIDLQGVMGFRTLADVQAMLDKASERGRAVVIGGGLLGLEAACALQEQGMQTTVVHSRSVLMNRQLDAEAGSLLAESLRKKGLQLELSVRSAAVRGDQGRVQGVELNDGRFLPADLVIFAAGVQPNIALMAKAGLPCEKGVLVDDLLRTADARISALGECVQFQGQTFGLVEPVYQQAEVLARHLLGQKCETYRTGLTATRLKVTGVELFSLGDYLGEQGDDQHVMTMPSQGLYRKLVFRESTLIGVLLYGDISDAPWYQQLLEQRADVSAFRDNMIFGQSYTSPQEELTVNAA